ncbi:MAG: hypothetical protein MOB07_14470 [Acidobacteria bacterium]|nr:hypothetical protein [Acidobacteriota bacterium]
MFLRKVLPEHHLSTETKDVVKLAMGLVGTMAALVIGLLVATAKTQYDTQRGEFTRMSANIILFDRVLANYGPEAEDTRELLRRAVVSMLDRMDTEKGLRSTQSELSAASELIYDKIQELSPQNEAQRGLQAQALRIGVDIGQTRWLLFEQQSESSIPMPFLVVLIFWLTLILGSFGLYAPINTTVLAALFICALSVSCAIFLILELDQPFEGLIHFSSTPLRNALSILGH